MLGPAAWSPGGASPSKRLPTRASQLTLPPSHVPNNLVRSAPARPAASYGGQDPPRSASSLSFPAPAKTRHATGGPPLPGHHLYDAAWVNARREEQERTRAGAPGSSERMEEKAARARLAQAAYQPLTVLSYGRAAGPSRYPPRGLPAPTFIPTPIAPAAIIPSGPGRVNGGHAVVTRDSAARAHAMTTPAGTTAELATPPAEPEATGPKVLGMSEVAGAGFLAAQREFHERCPNTPPPHVLVVNTLAGAQAAAARLLSPELRGRVFACDTEVSAIDVTSQSPCCHGDLICFSIHCGPDVDFGGGASPSVQSTLWVDTYLDGDASRKVG